jgi:acetyl esterase/lipase
MSAALTIMAKDRGGPNFKLQVLLIPTTDASVDTDSSNSFDTGRFLARDFMKFGWDIYAPDAKARKNPYVAPLQASIEQLRALPPAAGITAENDPLRDEGEAYARKLKKPASTSSRRDTMAWSMTSSSSTRCGTFRTSRPPFRQASDEIRRRLNP